MEKMQKNVVPGWIDPSGSRVPAFQRKEKWENTSPREYKEEYQIKTPLKVSEDSERREELLKKLEVFPTLPTTPVESFKISLTEKETHKEASRFARVFRNFMNFNHRLNEFFERPVINFFKKIVKSK
jgi:hypothetical protein